MRATSIMRKRPIGVGLLAGAALLSFLPAGARAPGDAGFGCPPGGSSSRVTAPRKYGFMPGKLVNMPSNFDREQVQIGYVRPATPASTRVPVIVLASPYFKGGLANPATWQCDPRLVQNYVPQGYAVAFVPVRGTADTGGCMDLMGPAERADLDQAITWLGTQSWSNGNVGMVGVSYDGSTPWEVAGKGNPYLKTIVPISGVNDPYHLMYRNGGNESRGALVLNALYYEYGFVEYNPTSGRSVSHSVSGALCRESLVGLGGAGYSTAAGERDPAGFWAARNSRPGVEQNYHGTIMLVQGLQDWNVDPGHQYPWVSELEQQGIFVKHVLGQWDHAWPDSRPGNLGRNDWADLLLHWFDRWLMGDLTAPIGARVEVQDSSLQWRTDDSWPPADASRLTFHLTDGFGLATAPSATESMTVIHPASERQLPSCSAACSAFTTETLAEPVRFAGRPQISVSLIPSGPGGHISATLRTRDGAIVGWGQLDLRFQEGSETARTVTPLQELTAIISLQPLDAFIPAGETLVLTLAQGSYGDHIESVPTYPVALRIGGDHSTLTLDTFARDGSSFFDPPQLGGGSAPL